MYTLYLIKCTSQTLSTLKQIFKTRQLIQNLLLLHTYYIFVLIANTWRGLPYEREGERERESEWEGGIERGT